ncbi:MAG: hypothetical protein MZV70_22310 [Desulfobacterales bacterium]|nr:hypothetical protein [Desulfobacterales bacterium]
MDTTTDSARTFGFMGAGRIVEILLDALGPAIGEGRGSIWNRTRSRAERLAERHGLMVQETPEDPRPERRPGAPGGEAQGVASVLTQAAPGCPPTPSWFPWPRGFDRPAPELLRHLPGSSGSCRTSPCPWDWA